MGHFYEALEKTQKNQEPKTPLGKTGESVTMDDLKDTMNALQEQFTSQLKAIQESFTTELSKLTNQGETPKQSERNDENGRNTDLRNSEHDSQ